jgi:nuclear factor of activated T-cells 5
MREIDTLLKDNTCFICEFCAVCLLFCQLVGYNKPATLQVFIGTDVGRVAPHMFYQACRVSGKNSTPCMERKIDGTIVIEVDFDPAKDMVIT